MASNDQLTPVNDPESSIENADSFPGAEGDLPQESRGIFKVVNILLTILLVGILATSVALLHIWRIDNHIEIVNQNVD